MEGTIYAERQAQKQQQRNTIAGLYLNAIQTPLPKTDDPAYKDALAKRENLMQQYVASMGPEQHASFGQHLHGLIFGEPDAAQPVHGNSPTPPQATATTPEAPPPQSDHPFAHNPVYAKIQQGIEGLSKHLKAGAHPIPPQTPDYASLAAAPSEGERKAQEAETLEKIKTEGALKVAQAKPHPRGSVQQQRFDAIARGMGLTGYDDPNITPEQSNQIADKVKQESLAPKYLTDPATGLVSHVVYDEQGNPHTEVVKDANGKAFGGFKPDQVRIVNGHYHYTDTVTGKVYDVPVTTETKTIFGPNVPEGKAPPTSSQAPNLSAINAGIASGNSTSKKLNKKKPVSSQAPQVPGQGKQIGQTAGLLDKSDAAQLTKLSEDANNKQEAYLSAKQALQHPTATSDQELIFSWVRSNVQGSGRMTQAEFQQAARAGSLPLRFRSVIERAKTGKLPPELEQMMLADIKRAADVSQQQVNQIRAKVAGPTSSQAPQMPSDQKVLTYNPATGKLE